MPDKLFDNLKREVAELDQLLNDPQPGLFTWCIAVGERWKAIAELWEPAEVKLEGMKDKVAALFERPAKV